MILTSDRVQFLLPCEICEVLICGVLQALELSCKTWMGKLLLMNCMSKFLQIA